jgi:acyl dehydratase
MSTTVNGVEGFSALVGQHLGYSDWVVIDQARIDRFAEATGDYQWIHVDAARAADGPFGATIAHGYLTLALAPALLQSIWSVTGVRLGVNYGANKIRFPAPVPVDAEVRLGATLAEATEVEGGAQILLDLAFEVKGASKPACVAQVVFRYFR